MRPTADRTLLVTVMLANNETGAIQPLAELASLAKARGALVHTDHTSTARQATRLHDPRKRKVGHLAGRNHCERRLAHLGRVEDGA